MMKQEMLDIRTVCECNRRLGCRTLHPQVSIINLAHSGVEQEMVKFEFYAVLLIEECGDGCRCCGRMYCDYSHATMVFLRPGEIFRMGGTGALPDKGRLLAFHPDLLFRTSLKKHIPDYTFFSYRKEEALHLSQRETATVVCCLGNIEEELQHAIDTHTGTILSRHIELLLDYCTRFYERQFITRENRNKGVMERLDVLLDAYIASGRLEGGELPAADYCAGALGLSFAYFNDLMRLETGKTWEEYFCFKRLELSKKMLLQEGHTPLFVAHRLGFSSVQYFSLVFKKITGISPNEYRYARN